MCARGVWLSRACSRFNCPSFQHHRSRLHLCRTNPNTRATIFQSAKAIKSAQSCLASPFVRLVQSPRVSAHIPIASRPVRLLSKTINVPCSVPFIIPALRMYPRGVGISARIRRLDVAVCPQKWLADLAMLVAAMNIRASSRPSVVPCMCAARIRRPRSGGTLV